MMHWHSILLLAGQAALAILTIELIRRNVFPRLPRLELPGLIIDVWAPVAIVLPMLFFAARIQGTVRGIGWMATGAPVMCALLAVGAALMIGFSDSHRALNRVRPRLWMACAAGGLLMLLLGVAHDLTIWMGQCAFALGAVVLWMNTPELLPEKGDASRPLDDNSAAAGFSMIVALGCGLVQGAISLKVDDRFAPICGALVMANAGMIVAWAARTAGPGVAIRIGGWAAIYGITLGLGVLSLLMMIPQAMHVLREEPVSRAMRVANGFGMYALEGTLLIAAAAIMASGSALRVRKIWLYRVAGLLLIGAAAALSGWRLAVS
jgi:hypothetical protein